MNTTLFNDLYELIKKEFKQKNFSKDDFFFFLISSNTFDSIDYTNIEPRFFIRGTIELCTTFGSTYFSILEHAKNLYLKNLFQLQYNNVHSDELVEKFLNNSHKQLSDLYNKHNITIPLNTNAEELFIRLCYECLKESSPLFTSYKNRQLKPDTLKNTFERAEASIHLKKLINQHHKVILSGELGSGKTHFIKYCLSTWKLNDYCYIEYEHNLNSTLAKIKFLDLAGNIFCDSSYIMHLPDIYSDSLLVIDNMYYSPDLFFELTILSTLHINLIIITTTEKTHDSFYNFKLPPLSENALHDIFVTTSTFSTEIEQLLPKLYNVSQKNVLMISLVAKQCKKIYTTPYNNLSPIEILDKLLARLLALNNHFDFKSNTTNRFKHTYDKKTVDLIGHIKEVYVAFLDTSNNNLREYLKYLCCFGWTPIPLAFVSIIIPSYNYDYIAELSEIGLISLTNNSVQVSPLISHAVIATENPLPTEYDSLVENLIDFLKDSNKTFSVPYLENILFIFAQTTYNNVPIKNNPKQKKTSYQFEKWQELLYLISNYYLQNSATDLVEQIEQLITYPEKIKKSHNAIDRDFFIINKITNQSFDINMLITKIDTLMKKLHEHSNDYNISTIDTTHFIFDIIDNLINQYEFTILSSLESNSINNNIYISLLKYAIPNLLHYLLYQEQDTLLNISIEQKKYYELYYNFICDTKILTTFQQTYCDINALKNNDYRIRGLAFTLFNHIIYLYDTHNLQSCLDLLPQIQSLTDLIHKCRLIPKHTLYLCLYSYIVIAMAQYIIKSDAKNNKTTPTLINRKNFHNLLIRCQLTKDMIDYIDSLITKYL